MALVTKDGAKIARKQVRGRGVERFVGLDCPLSTVVGSQVPQPITVHAPQDPADYNIWHHRRMTPRPPKTHQVSLYRCVISRDAGWTRGESARSSYCCMYFARCATVNTYTACMLQTTAKATGICLKDSANATVNVAFRGICHKGKDCDYLHQLPTEYHEQLLTSDHTVDIFGRDKLPGSHTGTKGVGTYDRESKTLYVNYGGAGHLGAPVIRQLLQVRLSLLASPTDRDIGYTCHLLSTRVYCDSAHFLLLS